MGTDIHLYVEQRDNETTPWRCLVPPERDLVKYPLDVDERVALANGTHVSPFWGPHGCMYQSKCYGTDGGRACEDASCPRCLGTGRDLQGWYHNRNYEAFAVLAGVRNRRDVTPIAEPRGIPADVSEPVRLYHAWDHSESYLGLNELLAFDWDNKSGSAPEGSGVIPYHLNPGRPHWACFENWAKQKKRVSPDSYCQEVGGGESRTIDERSARKLLKEGYRDPPNVQTHVRVTWKETHRTTCRDFLAFVDEFLVPLLGEPYQQLVTVLKDARIEQHPQLASLERQRVTLEGCVRIVFGFDS